MTTAILDQQMSANEIRQTRARLQAIVPHNGATRFKFDAGEELADFLKRCAILQSLTHQAGDYVIETD